MGQHNPFNRHPGVESVNGLSGEVLIDSPDSSITITVNDGFIHLESAGGGAGYAGRTAQASPVTMLDTDGVVNINLTVPGACAVAGATSRTHWKPYTIKDAAGNAGTDPITYTPHSGTIDGQATLLIQQNYDSITIYSDGTNEFTM